MTDSAGSTGSSEEKVEEPRDLELIDKDGVFSDMYLKDPDIQTTIQEILDSEELKKIKSYAINYVKAIEVLFKLEDAETEFKALYRKSLRKQKSEEEGNRIAKELEEKRKIVDELMAESEKLLIAIKLFEKAVPKGAVKLPALKRLMNKLKKAEEEGAGETESNKDDLKKSKLRALIKGRDRIRFTDLLDNVVPLDPAPLSPYQRLRRSLKLFREDPEYSTKTAYLAYLKSVYRFMVVPLEERPGLLYRTFYTEKSQSWQPSHDDAQELLEKLYLETEMIKKLPDSDWKKVKKSKDPEVLLNRLLYGMNFKPDFERLLKRIPWIISRDRYGAPALDLVHWRAPGTDVPQKPVAVDDEFIDRLIAGVSEHEAYAKIEIDDEFVELKNRKQIMERLKVDERVLIDSYVGVSKIERDFVLHKRLILWRNPGFEKYKNDSKIEKMRGSKPKPYLVLLQERAQQLEIPFITTETPTPKIRPKRVGPKKKSK